MADGSGGSGGVRAEKFMHIKERLIVIELASEAHDPFLISHVVLVMLNGPGSHVVDYVDIGPSPGERRRD